MRELKYNPHGALLFFWPELQRQIRIEGLMTKISKQESDQYFAGRPQKSQIGAWVSHQSEIIPDRQSLEDREKELEHKFKGQLVSRPDFWGGYSLSPDCFEFWQGRPHRLHDRIRYIKTVSIWKIERLAP